MSRIASAQTMPPDSSGSPMVDVSVVIVSYNTAALLRRCVASVFHGSSASTFEVIVVDNASVDGSADLVREEFPKVRLVALEHNVGFAAGVNRGVADATGRYILLLNPDAELHERTLDELCQFADAHPGHGIYGGRILNEDGVDPRSCWGLPSPWSLFCFASGLSSLLRGSRIFDPESLGRWPRDSVREVGAISGALMLVDRGLWSRIGGFDTRYFMYSEDIDLCVRARALGHRPLHDPAATAVHAAGASSSATRKAVLVMKGKATFLRQRWSPGRRTFGLTMLWLGTAVRAAASRAIRRGGVWPEVWAERKDWIPGYVEPRQAIGERV